MQNHFSTVVRKFFSVSDQAKISNNNIYIAHTHKHTKNESTFAIQILCLSINSYFQSDVLPTRCKYTFDLMFLSLIFLFLKSSITLTIRSSPPSSARQCANPCYRFFQAKTKTTFSFPGSLRSCALRARWFKIILNIFVLFPTHILNENCTSTEGGSTK